MNAAAVPHTYLNCQLRQEASVLMPYLAPLPMIDTLQKPGTHQDIGFLEY